MPSREDLDVARQLLGAGVVTEVKVRAALEEQVRRAEAGEEIALLDLLIDTGVLPTVAAKAFAAPDPLEGQPFPNYRLETLLGEGGSSRVYRATYLPNGATVAVKVLDPIQGLRADLKERFYDEARLLIELDHENVVAGYEVGSSKGLHFFSLDYIEGPTVLQMIERAERIEHGTALWITIQIAKALDYMHGRKLIHRDIKPGNVMIDATGRARIIDLGLVRRMDEVTEEEAGAEDEKTVGTVEYISPEQARGRGDLDVRTDIYSLGVTLYHMVVGDVPFHGETNYEVMAQHILSGLDAQKVKTRRIPPEINFVIAKMMSKEREHRYENCAQVVADLTRFLPAGGPPPIVLPVAPEPVKSAPPTMKPLAPKAGAARPAAPSVARPAAPRVAPVAKPVAKPAAAPPMVRPAVVAPPVAKPVVKPVAVPPVVKPPVVTPPVATPPIAKPPATPGAPVVPPVVPPAVAATPPEAPPPASTPAPSSESTPGEAPPATPSPRPPREGRPPREDRPPREGRPKRRGVW